jgi:hypothetical protein
MFEQIRHYSRWVLNGLALFVAVAGLPEFITIVPPDVTAWTVGAVAVANQVISWLRAV